MGECPEIIIYETPANDLTLSVSFTILMILLIK